MLIKTEAKREGGSLHEVGGTEYLFKPIAKGGDHVCDVENNGHIQRFLSIPGFEIYDPNAKPEPVSDSEGDEGDADAPAPLEEAPDEVLDQLYRDAYGKAPHHKFSREKIIDMIRTSMVQKGE